MLKKAYTRRSQQDGSPHEEWDYRDGPHHVANITRGADSRMYCLYVNDQAVTMHGTLQEAETALSTALRTTIDNAA